MHALRGEQVIDADRGERAADGGRRSRHASSSCAATRRVAGGSGTLDSMSARDIDLDYTDDGETLERVLLTGGGAMAHDGQDGGARPADHRRDARS